MGQALARACRADRPNGRTPTGTGDPQSSACPQSGNRSKGKGCAKSLTPAHQRQKKGRVSCDGPGQSGGFEPWSRSETTLPDASDLHIDTPGGSEFRSNLVPRVFCSAKYTGICCDAQRFFAGCNFRPFKSLTVALCNTPALTQHFATQTANAEPGTPHHRIKLASLNRS